MTNLVYKRVSTDQQSIARQNLVVDEAGIEDPVTSEEQACTSSRLHPLQRPKFGELNTYARAGDTVHISERKRQRMRMPEIAREMTRRWISEVPSRMV
jgi:DNA invertase Pin-like site-specific DNA recombinase